MVSGPLRFRVVCYVNKRRRGKALYFRSARAALTYVKRFGGRFVCVVSRRVGSSWVKFARYKNGVRLRPRGFSVRIKRKSAARYFKRKKFEGISLARREWGRKQRFEQRYG